MWRSAFSAPRSSPTIGTGREPPDREPVDSILLRADALVTALVMGAGRVKRETVHTLRLMSRLDDEHRAILAEAGAIPHLVELLLTSPEACVQEDAITCLLNLSILAANKKRIMETRGALDTIVGTLRSGATSDARRNAATTVFSLASMDEYRIVMGQAPHLVPALLELMRDGSSASAKDAIRALFHLSLCSDNKPRLVTAGTLPTLLAMLHTRSNSEDALALLGQLCGCDQGLHAFLDGGDGDDRMAMLVALLEPVETPRCREQAAAALLILCQTGGDAVVQRLHRLDHCVSALCSLLSTGSHRAKSKAGALLQLLVVSERS